MRLTNPCRTHIMMRSSLLRFWAGMSRDLRTVAGGRNRGRSLSSGQHSSSYSSILSPLEFRLYNVSVNVILSSSATSVCVIFPLAVCTSMVVPCALRPDAPSRVNASVSIFLIFLFLNIYLK